ncbi:Hsp90 protein [Popillia japonica]|uniref:Heat shock protein 83 n=1 Tax=Popillia japonica TaxID=7064 RepID=A0AAW1NKV5_POPJA
MKQLAFLILGLFIFIGHVKCDVAEGEGTVEAVDIDLGASREGSRTDDEVVKREEEAIKLDGLNVAQMKELREKSEKFQFQTEVNRMMKLIINSLYRNKEIFLRELISNASDALDKIRLMSLTDPNVLDTNSELNIRIKADKEGNMLHITDTGIGMTKSDLISNLGTIAKSGTAEFLSKMQDASAITDMNDMIGQFGVGFYSAFLVADKVVVTSKHNSDIQYIWESDAGAFSIVEDPRGDTLKRGTTISLQLKPEAKDFLEQDTIRNLVKKYSQFINFPIYLWASRTEQVEEVIEEEAEETEKSKPETSDEDAAVEEEEAEEDKPKTKKVDKTIWDWELLNDSKPIWTRKATEVEDKEYDEFYKALTKDSTEPLTKVHFVAEGEVTFKALLFVPKVQPSESFNRYGTKTDNIKLYVRRVFITDEFNDMMPNYLNFIRGIVDSDDLPLNVSRETLQQHKLIKVIKKKLVRKVLDMLKKIPEEQYEKFWKEYSTNIKLGTIEDPSNRTRLAKLLMFHSSNSDNLTSLSDYVKRMKSKQERIFYIAGATKDEVKKSPFVERLLRKGYEVLYLVEAVDEYTISAIPEFEGKKFQNVAKEGFSLTEAEGGKKQLEQYESQFEPLTKWLADDALKEHIAKATVSERLSDSPCALVASMFGWTGNMERLAISNAHQKADDPQRSYYLNQKKTLEINPRHPLMRELLKRVNDDPSDPTAKDMAVMLFKTATLRSGYMLKETHDFAHSIEMMMRKTLGVSTLRSGYMLKETHDFAHSIEMMMRKTLGVSLDEQVEEEEDIPEDGIPEEEVDQEVEADNEEHDEL